jgi:hypothetical protein
MVPFRLAALEDHAMLEYQSYYRTNLLLLRPFRASLVINIIVYPPNSASEDIHV